MIKLFRYFLLSVVVCLTSVAVDAQNQTKMKIVDFKHLQTDMDAKVNYPIEDWNGNTCAIIKIETTEKGFTFETGTIEISKVDYRPGEVWVYVSKGVRKITIFHETFGVCRNYEIPMPIESGNVYLLTLQIDAAGGGNGIYIERHDVDYGYLKMSINPKNAIVYIGKTEKYELATSVVDDGHFSQQLNFGTYYYKVESDMFDTAYGKVVFDAKTPAMDVNLTPAYNSLVINSSPEQGATVLINNRPYGKTPLRIERIKKGMCTITLSHDDYSMLTIQENLPGGGTERVLNYTMNPQFGTVTCTAKGNAEIWIDNERKGTGSWSGRLSSTSSHIVEARLPNHYSQSRKINVENGKSITVELDAPIAKYATLDLDSNPSFAKVFLDGKEIGETPTVQQVLMGEHEIVIMKEGYLNAKEKVNLAEHENRRVVLQMQKGVVYVPVVLETASDAEIFVDGTRKGTGSWTGVLPEGQHVFKATKVNHEDATLTANVVSNDGRQQKIRIPSPAVLYGNINVKTNKSGVSVYVDDSYMGSQSTYKVPAGYHKVSVAKNGYNATPYSRNVTVNPNSSVMASFNLKKDYSKSFWVGNHPYKSSHYLEFLYGYGVPSGNGGSSYSDNPYYDGSYDNPYYDNPYYGSGAGSSPRMESSYLGFEYGWQPSGLGLRTSMMFGLDNDDFIFTAGPSLRLTGRRSSFDLQWYLGVGGMYNPNYSKSFEMAYDTGLRFGFDSSTDFGFYSLSLGAKYYNNMVIPNAGISMFLFNPDLYDSMLGGSEYAEHYVDVIMGYGVEADSFHLGMSYAYVDYILGGYATFMYEFGDICSFAVGPVLRLNPDGYFDMQLYGGIGMNASDYRGNNFLGDVGIRFGWSEQTSLAWWDLSMGCMFFGGEVVPTISLGLGLSLTTILAAAAVIGAVMYEE